MKIYCTKCGRELQALPAYINNNNWQCTRCFEIGVRRCHTPLREKNVTIRLAAHSTYDKNYIELTNKPRVES